MADLNNDQLISYINRLEALNDEIANLSEDKKTILAEAKGAGFDKKAILHVIKQRKKNKQQRDEEDILFKTYENAVGLD